MSLNTDLEDCLTCLLSPHVQDNKHRLGALGTTEIDRVVYLLKRNLHPVEEPEDIISDGFGSHWSIVCPECNRKSMHVVRPGKVQCGEC
jgi:hypothetical protein